MGKKVLLGFICTLLTITSSYAQNVYFKSPPSTPTVSQASATPGKKNVTPDEFARRVTQINAQNKEKDKQALQQKLSKAPVVPPAVLTDTTATTATTTTEPAVGGQGTTVTTTTSTPTPSSLAVPAAPAPVATTPTTTSPVYTGFPSAPPAGTQPARSGGSTTAPQGGGGWNIQYR